MLVELYVGFDNKIMMWFCKRMVKIREIYGKICVFYKCNWCEVDLVSDIFNGLNVRYICLRIFIYLYVWMNL